MPAFAAYRFLTIVVAVIAVGFSSPPAQAQLSATDKGTLAELALHWAVTGGIPDVKLLKNPSKLIVVNQNLPPRTELHVAKHTVAVLPPIRIQVEADMIGDFLYFRIGPFKGEGNHASVPIALLWAVGVKSKATYLSGGGATLEFERHKGKWTLRPVTERWTS